MPLHIPAVGRRQFLTQSAAALAGLSILRIGYAAEGDQAVTLALLSDTHVPETPMVEARGVNMTANLQKAVEEINALPTKPAAVLFNGDCAYLKGLPRDYANFAQCVQPLIDTGQELHMTMGNHDNIPAFYGAMASQKPEQPLVESKHVGILETPYANIFLLDSLMTTNVVTGELGAAQLKWLSQALDAHANKPAVIMAHHTLDKSPPQVGKAISGLADTAELLELLHSKPHVKAYVFGHSHVWAHTHEGDLNLINLPACAYVFNEAQPNGWTLARVNEKGIEFELQAHDKSHKKHGQVFTVKWA
ncbi:metallophosphoesterase family protein [Blastopirellula retiformator]|uniref:3',5'-cyclic adenosine monophosphate phosphodiesterase CpdA n=1 Tax=Blastopirellula retiformator TaxID=2527970 RepID=A0A5C5V108_9BACT|nr:metallophosphoesterase [Blastopirellula retiformator]TWT31422.1 3',5'-cyclic adenosine monophosphate phosphodiesterase CpdA [Blastopirellula retiformator]